MSVLSFPRIYFNGYMGWDVCTGNNNDYLPIYDATNAALDWSYLSQFGIDQSNFRDRFRKWFIEAYCDTCPPPCSDHSPPTIDTASECNLPGGGTTPDCQGCEDDPNRDTCHMASRWDYYGSAGSWFTQYQNKVTQVSGGVTAYNTPADPEDPLLHAQVEILGNVFGDRVSPARLVDINSRSPFCSQIFFAGMKISKGDTTFLSGKPTHRMFSRSFFVPRNIGPFIIAGAIGVVFQSTFKLDDLDYDNSSPLLNALIAQARDSAGITWQFSAYNTMYYQNGAFNNIPQQPKNADELIKMYQHGMVFMNPAYSRIMGTFGVWKAGELETAPSGRHLVSLNKIPTPTPPGPAAKLASLTKGAVKGVSGGHAAVFYAKAEAEPSGPPPFLMGPVWADFDLDAGIVSLNMVNAILEYDAAGNKVDYGTIDVGLVDPDGAPRTFEKIASIPYSDYGEAGYTATSGLVDIKLTMDRASLETQLHAGRVLALRVSDLISHVQRVFTAETDARGIYIDESQTASASIQVTYRNGARLPDGATLKLKLAQYFPWPLNVGTGLLVRVGATPPTGGTESFCNTMPPSNGYVQFVDGDIIDVDTLSGLGFGTATVRLKYVNPGFPVVAFYPYLSTQPEPTPQDILSFSPSGDERPQYLIGDAYFMNIRTLPPNDELMQQFVDCWNGTGEYEGQPKFSRQQAWQFIYFQILYVYDMLFPVMDNFMPLGELDRVEGAVDQLQMMIQESWVDASTLYMPVTRDLSAGKRWILEEWIKLVKARYPQKPISLK